MKDLEISEDIYGKVDVMMKSMFLIKGIADNSTEI